MKFPLSRLPLLLFSLFLISTLWGCKKTGCTDPAALNYDPLAQRDCCCEYANTGTLSFKVIPLFGSSSFELGHTFYQSSGTPFKLNFTAFYFSGFVLMSDTGEVALKDQYIYYRGDSSGFQLTDIPTGKYTGLRFLIGIDSITNYSNLPAQYDASHALGPKTPLMHWSWNAGYIFLRFDGEVDTSLIPDDIMDDGLTFHIGTNKYLSHVRFNKSFTVDENKQAQINLNIDYARFFEGIDLRKNHVTHTSDYPTLTDKFWPNISKAFSMP